MASSSGTPKRSRTASMWRTVRYTLIGLAVTCALAGAIYGAQSVERFLISDPRFVLAGPPDYGQESPNVQLSGVKWASRTDILRVFQRDYGRSLYLLPLSERRASLLRINWVRAASITRIWPNEIAVHVDERQPVAFVPVPFGPMSRYALIDADGVVLEPPQRAKFDLPVILGVSAGSPLAERAMRVHRMQRLLTDIGSLGTGISEIDVSDLDNLRIREQIDNQTVLLDLGERAFASRMRTFSDQFPNIRHRLAQSAELDLRIDDQIIAVPPNTGGGRQ